MPGEHARTAQGSGLSSGVTEGCSGRDVLGKPPPNVSGTAAVPGPGSAGSRLRPKLRMDYLVKGYVELLTIIATSVLTEPANAPAPWPHVAELEDTASKLKIKYDKVPLRGSNHAVLYAYAQPIDWRLNPCAERRPSVRRSLRPSIAFGSHCQRGARTRCVLRQPPQAESKRSYSPPPSR